ncbi:RNA polymerase sigma factor [Microbacterium profundi]|uniref:RNA polymerase sigma factor n=1 Tax=Microbacterium profundi TaxID=450380 RepID=UPI0019D00929|nr:RNA polymerase sigma factor [Microbacterium profundi]MCE7481049.1 RNA polymerase sigma factor [Microbacterium profundi]
MGIDAGEEAATWQRALSGSGAAYASLFREHEGRVYRRALSIVRDVHGAEDVTSATFFELWRKRRAVRVVDGSVLPWLLVTTVNLARNHRRGSLRYRALIATLPREESPDAESIALSNVETMLLGVRLSDALARVNRSDVALLVLTAVDGLSISDAAAAIGIKPGTARMRLSRARERLQASLTNEQHRFSQAAAKGENA